jgi:hypothetical protein
LSAKNTNTQAQELIDALTKDLQNNVVNNYYLIEPYNNNENLSLFYKKLGSLKFDWLLESIARMDSANTEIRNAQDIDKQGIDLASKPRGMLMIGKYNSEILNLSKTIKRRLTQINEAIGGASDFCTPYTIPN